LAEKPAGDIRDHIANALDSLGYESVEDLVTKLITQTRPHKQEVICPRPLKDGKTCGWRHWILVEQPAPDKIAKGLEILANQAKGAPGRAADKDKPPSMADGLKSMTNEQLAKLAGG
jgi:hypothetical protein